MTALLFRKKNQNHSAGSRGWKFGEKRNDGQLERFYLVNAEMRAGRSFRTVLTSRGSRVGEKRRKERLDHIFFFCQCFESGQRQKPARSHSSTARLIEKRATSCGRALQEATTKIIYSVLMSHHAWTHESVVKHSSCKTQPCCCMTWWVWYNDRSSFYFGAKCV